MPSDQEARAHLDALRSKQAAQRQARRKLPKVRPATIRSFARILPEPGLRPETIRSFSSILPARRRPSRPGPEVYLIGLGLPEERAVTHHAYRALRSCRTLFARNPRSSLLKQACPDVRPVGELDGHLGGPRYAAFAQNVLAAARRAPPVGLAVYGHPLVYEGLALEVLRACRAANASIAAISGISTVEALLALMRISTSDGVGLHVTNAIHLRRAAPDVSAYVMVLKACDDLKLLRGVADRCLRYYPPHHRVALARCPSWKPGRVRWMELRDLRTREQRPDVYATLVIPPLTGLGPRASSRKKADGA